MSCFDHLLKESSGCAVLNWISKI
uniref:Uncharacterized protein n=1 Tax=Arundo donax TaxID=35708 RepID=A0A0A8ZJ27_ARUDO